MNVGTRRKEFYLEGSRFIDSAVYDLEELVTEVSTARKEQLDE